MSGQSITVGQGSVSAVNGLTIALVGVAIVVSAGVMLGSQSGQQVAVSSGSIAASATTVALTGSATTISVGTLIPNGQQPALVGSAMTSAAGSVVALGNDVTVNISGEETDSAQGLIDAGHQMLGGLAITVGQESPTLGVDMPLSGAASVFSMGLVAPDQAAVDTLIISAQGTPGGAIDTALTGSFATGAQGTLTVTGDAFIALTGSEIDSAAGTAGFEFDFPLTGSQFTAQQSSVGAPGTAALTGSSASVIDGLVFITNDRAFALTGQSASVIDGLAVTSYLAFATGQVLAVGQATIGPVNVALIGVEIGAAQGVVTPPPPVVRPGGGGHPHKPPKRKSREERIADAQRDEPKKVVVKKTKKKAEPTEDEKELAFILQIIKDML